MEGSLSDKAYRIGRVHRERRERQRGKRQRRVTDGGSAEEGPF